MNGYTADMFITITGYGQFLLLKSKRHSERKKRMYFEIRGY